MALKKATDRLLQQIIEKQASNTQRDMRAYRNAKRKAMNPDCPHRTLLIDLLEDMYTDTHLSSQVELRVERSLRKPFIITNSKGDKNEEVTRLLSESIVFGELLQILLETPYWGHSLFELSHSDTDLFKLDLLPRRHVIPAQGILLRDVADSEGIHYREDPRYMQSIIEVGNPKDLGILIDCVPDTIYRRHAKVAWVEFCEIFGVPPRILKMDTDDTEAMHRAEEMLTRMGRAAWIIIDQNEEMNFGNSVAGNTDIFERLNRAAKEDISVKICGGVIGQDTAHGNRSKEEVALKILDGKCNSDRMMVVKIMNSTIMPALASLGYIPQGLRFGYPDEEDKGALWDRTVQAMQHFDVDEEWIRNTFGIQVTGKKQLPLSGQLKAQLNATQEDHFFG